jgi:hypothetical protein
MVQPIHLFIYFTIWLSVLFQYCYLLFDTGTLKEHAAPICMAQISRSLEEAGLVGTLRHTHFQNSRYITTAKTKGKNVTAIIIREYLCITFLSFSFFIFSF